MKKETLVEKLARKAFESGEVQKSWAVHMQAFGPILEPAFAGDYQTRVELTAALNKISRRDLKGGLEKLKKLQEKCVTDADKAAWLFFMGVCMEMAGAREQMIACYREAGELGHRFYLPYLKLAKAAQGNMDLYYALENYRMAFCCLEDAPQNEQTRMILASAHANLASCRTLMRNYDEAFWELEISEHFCENLPGRSGTAAIAYAAIGNLKWADSMLEKLKTEAPAMLEQVRGEVEKIRAGTHPHFCARSIEQDEITKFWNWFIGNEDVLLDKVSCGDEDNAARMIFDRLQPLFSFNGKNFWITVDPQEEYITVNMWDFFSYGVYSVCLQLLDSCPETVAERWRFEIYR